MAKFCNHCGKEIVFPQVFTCAYCYKTYCPEHRLVEDHRCPPAMAVKPVEKHHDAEKEEQKAKETSKSMGITPSWMYNRLKDAQHIINTYHKDESSFFSSVEFNLFIQEDMKSAYSYINGTAPYYRIGIHPSLLEDTPEKQRMVTIVLVHELLHALHSDWGHDKINLEEKRLANLGNYFDSLRNMEVLYLSGNMQLCSK